MPAIFFTFLLILQVLQSALGESAHFFTSLPIYAHT
jgi:hypothetical protein